MFSPVDAGPGRFETVTGQCCTIADESQTRKGRAVKIHNGGAGRILRIRRTGVDATEMPSSVCQNVSGQAIGHPQNAERCDMIVASADPHQDNQEETDMDATTVAVDLAKSVFELAIADVQWRITLPSAPEPDAVRASSARRRRRTSSWRPAGWTHCEVVELWALRTDNPAEMQTFNFTFRSGPILGTPVLPRCAVSEPRQLTAARVVSENSLSRKELYVAHTRGAKSLTIISSMFLLAPAA